MYDIILDTNLLADFISGYYSFGIQDQSGKFERHYNISDKLASEINERLENFINYNTLDRGLIIASSFAFIEIGRKFDIIVSNRFTIEKFRAFIDSPPEWFSISPVNNDLFQFLNELPNSVKLENGSVEPVEWADAIHVATALGRENGKLAVTDQRLVALPVLKGKLVLQE